MQCIVNLLQIYASRDSRDGELDYQGLSINSHHAREKSHVVADTHSTVLLVHCGADSYMSMQVPTVHTTDEKIKGMECQCSVASGCLQLV